MDQPQNRRDAGQGRRDGNGLGDGAECHVWRTGWQRVGATVSVPLITLAVLLYEWYPFAGKKW